MQEIPQSVLSGVRVLEFAGIGPVPHCGMVLADMGADIIRINRPGTIDEGKKDIQGRGKRAVVLDLKKPGDCTLAKKLMTKADILMEGFRPGVMEKLGLGPDMALAANPRLVYGRMSGWGQDGPMAKQAGHDINYIAITGALGALGAKDAPPFPPLNLVGDYGGGSMFLALGLLAGLLHARAKGEGQIIDAAIIDGTLGLLAPIYWLQANGVWQTGRQSNILDGGAHFYASYVCADGKFMAVGAIEAKFYNELCDKLNLGEEFRKHQYDRDTWPVLSAKLAGIFAAHPQQYWRVHFANSDACVIAIEDMISAAKHPQIIARNSLLNLDGIVQPAPAPRFSKTPSKIKGPPPGLDADPADILRAWDL